MAYLSVFFGLVFLVFAGDKLVAGAVAIAERLNVSKLIVGITVVSFGTSAPELVVGIDAALSGVADLALGNIIGSNIANVLLVLGVPALLYPFTCDDRGTLHSLGYMLVASVLFVLLSVFGSLHIWQGLIMLALLAMFLYFSILRAKRSKEALEHEMMLAAHALEDIEAEKNKSMSLFKALAITLLGLAGLIFGAHILVDGAVIIARTYGISEAVIGLTIIAIGTSLPELVTSIMAARHNHGDVAMGNIIGSNLFNILAIMGITSLVAPVPIPPQFFIVEFPILLATALLLVPFAMGKIRISRLSGAFFCLSYVLYLVYLAADSNVL